MDTDIKFGKFEISLPNETSSMFGIFENLTEFLGVEYQSEAVEKLKIALEKVSLKPKPNIDFESDYTQIDSKSADTIFSVAKIINNISLSKYRIDFKEKELDEIYKKLKKWKRPPRQKWKIGDIISVPMSNNSFAFGQVIGTHLTKTSPILVLFDLTKENSETSIEELIESRPLSVNNSYEDEIKNHLFKVLFNCKVLVSPERVPNKKFHGGVNLSTLADVYFGLEPWNIMNNENYYGKYFLPEIGKPENIIWLSDEEKVKYWEDKKNGWQHGV
ncbi:Imm26 family immunity protein [Maribacter sp. BPC-D8]|uniref:Imm26 family immunity protein n=1 Tax=Maribacter sp. BPC-D8 TaxID=3053613 RepID=UPI002B47708F|nr:Imm26 family immunity protein [Maribacter sp. BPC-D8]WRI31501.1 Imm26 family immunity protein [Maribacter sp. BPC-D8]